jgi:hypothetical protein
MKAGVLYLIIGGTLLAIGLGIAGFSTVSVTRQLMQGSAIIDHSRARSFDRFGDKEPAGGAPALLSLTGDPADVPLHETITGPGGAALASYDIKKMPFTVTTSTKESGDTTLEIKNPGSRAAVISGGLISTPVGPEAGGVSVKDNSSFQSLVAYGIGILV